MQVLPVMCALCTPSWCAPRHLPLAAQCSTLPLPRLQKHKSSGKDRKSSGKDKKKSKVRVGCRRWCRQLLLHVIC